MTKGWFVGPFSPSAFFISEAEVAYKKYAPGEIEPEHFQLTATEVTLIISGEARIGKEILHSGDILVIPPMESADFEALTEVALVAVKSPAIPSDRIVGSSANFRIQMVIPMAGLGSRFADVGYLMPKPLIDVGGKPMIQRVVENLSSSLPQTWTFITQSSHLEKYPLEETLRSTKIYTNIISITGQTRGAAETVLLGCEDLELEMPLIVANCDQYIDFDLSAFYLELFKSDGLILTMPADDPKWSFVRQDESGLVVEVAEKKVISNLATVGIYGFRRAGDFVNSARSMIAKEIRTNNEFYVAPVYNEMIGSGMQVRTFDVGDKMFGIGTPEDLSSFLSTFKFGQE
jgi:dTDP-glucose pyrophosphorylase